MQKSKPFRDQQFIQIMDIFTTQLCPTCTSYLQLVNVSVEEKMKPSDPFDVFIQLKCLHCNYTGTRELIIPEEL